MHCERVPEQLGPWIDGELPEPQVAAIEAHLQTCDACRREADQIRRLAGALEAQERSRGRGALTPIQIAALWQRIETTLDARPAQPGPRVAARPAAPRWRLLRPMLAAAAVLVAVGLGTYSFVATNGPAVAAEIDLRPFLKQSGRDIAAGVQALIDRYGGRRLDPAELARTVRLRIHLPDALPLGLKLDSTYLLHMGHHHKAAALLLRGTDGQLLLIQCPGGTKKELGNVQCLPCRIGGKPGHLAEVGPLQIGHIESPNVCVCIVSALPSTDDLSRVLEKVRIDF